MTKINIKTSNFKELLKIVKLEGKDVDGSNSSMIENCILECKNGKLTTNVLGKSGVVFANINYKKVDVISEGEICIGNIDVMLEFLSRFDNEDIINVETTENKIKITRENPKKTAIMTTTAREHIDDSLRVDNVKDSIKKENEKWTFGNTILDSGFKVDVNFMKNVLDDGNVSILRRKYPIIIGENVSCKVGDEQIGVIESVLLTENKEGVAKSCFGGGIDNVFKNLEGVVEVWLANDGPMLVILENEKVDGKFVIAPLINED